MVQKWEETYSDHQVIVDRIIDLCFFLKDTYPRIRENEHAYNIITGCKSSTYIFIIIYVCLGGSINLLTHGIWIIAVAKSVPSYKFQY